MRAKELLIIVGSLYLSLTSCHSRNYVAPEHGKILKVPSQFSTIRQAVESSSGGDWIILAPGKYIEKNIDINKPVTISSEWKISGNVSRIEETVIDSKDSILFNILTDSVEISGLKMINGDHPLNITAKAIIRNNHFINSLDAISFEGSGGGYAGWNTIENDRDDGIDLDIRYGEENRGSDITVEYNTITGSHDDGMEIRLYDYPDQHIKYNIYGNRIMNSNNAGIQIISYDVFTAKEFRIHHNIIIGCKTGFGCMEGANTREDMTGASKMDELVFLYNNTLSGNQTGATGGNNIVAFNNVVQANKVSGFKRFGKNSVISNNLFYRNAEVDLVEIQVSDSADGNMFFVDPLLDSITFEPLVNSPCIDAGKKNIEYGVGIMLEVPDDLIQNGIPDLGAVERNTLTE